MSLSRAVSDIDWRFPAKIANFPHPRVFNAPNEGVPLGIGYQRWRSKSRMMGLPGQTRSLTISSVVWIQSTNVTDRQTDRRTDTGRQQRPRLRIASRDKNQTQYASYIKWTTNGRNMHFNTQTSLCNETFLLSFLLPKCDKYLNHHWNKFYLFTSQL